MKRTYWILTTIHECPICGRGNTYRERIYNRPKPKEPSKRYEYHDTYDYCDAL